MLWGWCFVFTISMLDARPGKKEGLLLRWFSELWLVTRCII